MGAAVLVGVYVVRPRAAGADTTLTPPARRRGLAPGPDDRLREVSADPELTVLRLLGDRSDELSKARAQGLNRMHRLFLELVPGGPPVKKSVSQYKALLATVRPRDAAWKMRRRMAAEERPLAANCRALGSVPQVCRISRRRLRRQG